MARSLFALAALVYVAVGQMTINSPASLCEPTLISWTGGTAPYYLSIIPGGQPSAAALESFATQTGTSYTWTVDLAAGTDITLSLKDSTGSQVYSAEVKIQAGSTTSCPASSTVANSAAGASATSASSEVSSKASGASSVASSGATSASSVASSAASSMATVAKSGVSSAAIVGTSAVSKASSAASSAASAAASTASTSGASSLVGSSALALGLAVVVAIAA